MAHLDVQVRLYDALPTWRIISFDEVLHLPAFGAAPEGHRSGMHQLTTAANGVLHAELGIREGDLTTEQYTDAVIRARR